MDQRDPNSTEERVSNYGKRRSSPTSGFTMRGQVVVHTQVDTVPARLEVDALHEEVEVVHEPVGEPVSARREP